MDATRLPMLEVLAFVEAELARGVTSFELEVADPDSGAGLHAGELLPDGRIHRPLRAWLDLAERLRLRLLTPARIDATTLRLRFELLAIAKATRGDDPTERYGAASVFARISKLEDPRFVLDLAEAIDRVTAAREITRVVDLGCNTGDVLAYIRSRLPHAALTGVDHSATALARARERIPDATWIAGDLAALPTLALGDRFDLVLAIATLQSGALDDRELLRQIVQHVLAPDGAIILGIPNCRYVDGEIEYGARMKNFTQPELGLVVKDVAYFRKYLQQHHRQVFVTGKHYLFVTAVSAETR